MGSLRKYLKGVQIGNCKNGRNLQNGPKMAKIQKWHYCSKKVAFKYIKVNISSFWMQLSPMIASKSMSKTIKTVVWSKKWPKMPKIGKTMPHNSYYSCCSICDYLYNLRHLSKKIIKSHSKDGISYWSKMAYLAVKKSLM